MNQLSDRLNSLSPSATLAMSQKSAELKAQGAQPPKKARQTEVFCDETHGLYQLGRV